MARPKGSKNAMPSKSVQRQLLRDLTCKAMAGDVQAAGVVLNYAALMDKQSSIVNPETVVED